MIIRLRVDRAKKVFFLQKRNVTENYEKMITRNAIEKTLQKKKEEQQRLKKHFLELPRESKNSSGVFFFLPKKETKAYWKFQRTPL